MDLLWLVLIGLGIGTFGVMVGTGGGLVLVPILLLFFDMSPAVVTGTSLALVAVNSFGGSTAYHRLGLVDRRSGLLFAGAAIPGSVVAPFAVEAVAGGTFRALFGLLLVSLAIYMAFRPNSRTVNSRSIQTFWTVAAMRAPAWLPAISPILACRGRNGLAFAGALRRGNPWLCDAPGTGVDP